MPNGDEGRAEFERMAREKDAEKQAYADKHGGKSYPVDMLGNKPTQAALDKMHAEDDAQSVEDAKRFTEEQKAMALSYANAYMEKMFEAKPPVDDEEDPYKPYADGGPYLRAGSQGHPLRATEDAAMTDSFGNSINAVSRNSKTLPERAGVITPRQHSRGPLRTLPELADMKKTVEKPAVGSDGFPGGRADEVDFEDVHFEYKGRDGKNLDEMAEDMIPDACDNLTIGKGGSEPQVRNADDTGWEAPKRILHTPEEVGCVRPDPFDGPLDGEKNPWDDPNRWPSPPTELPTGLSDEAREKLKDTIEKMGQGADGGGFRMNAGKNEIELLPEIWIWALADVMTQGARKYPARNWEKGMDWSAMIGCMYRHLAKFQSGQRYDGKEFNKKLGTTGCHELAMIAWNALALMFYDIYGLGENDLPVYDNFDHFVRVNAASSDLNVRWPPIEPGEDNG